jgi:two-component system nitrogen regulation response regulator GlnG
LPEHFSPPIAAELVQGAVRECTSLERIHELIYCWARDALNDPARSSQAYDELRRLVEPPLLKAAMEKHGSNCAAAARELGMHRITLRRKLDQYGMK